jgi:BppU N-terminal domain
MSLTFVQGDTAPDITAIIHQEDDPLTPVNLAGASVKFQMRKSDDRRFTINATATIVTPAAGAVSYSWAANDLSVPGTYEAQWEVTFPGGRIQTTATTETLTIRRQ